ncbi:MAG: sorbosone dehydrogenase family protein [Chitinophagaceae bacterium]|nr:sorbosone dehydrogenase family protein [Chitinophagaceae bacterium]
MRSLLASIQLIFIFLVVACNNSETSSDNATTATVIARDSLFEKYQLAKIKLPPGFQISVYAEVPNARSLCIGEKGTVFAGNRAEDNVYAIVDLNKDGKADSIYIIAKGLNTPNGVAFRNGSLYVAEINRIIRYDSIESRLGNPPQPVVVYDKFPSEKHHGWKFIAFGPDDKLYVPVGAPCNICAKEDPIFSSITRMNPDGSGFEIFAKGIRNSVGFAWHPDTKELWFTENGRDEMGDDVPLCELNHAPKAGMDFGFPFCHQGDVLDPEFGKGKKCSDYIAPAQLLGPHVAPLGMRFYTGATFPAEYKNRIFMALHGSWNRSIPAGYSIMTATLEGNKVSKYEPFATGFLQHEKDVLGRPVDIQLLPDGNLLVSDDKNGVIYRIGYKG